MGVRLPAEYQEVEYIEGTGTQWIDTGIVPHTNTKAQIKVMNLRVTGDVIFGYYEDGDETDWRLFNYTSEVYFDLLQAGGSYGKRIIGRGASFKPNIVKELEIGNFYVKDLTNDSVIAQADAFEYTGNYSITLNAYGSENRRISLNRWYYVKIYDGNDIVFNGITCYRKSDNKPGMYDLVTEQFFVNQGTGEFVVGNDVIDHISQALMSMRRMIMAMANGGITLPDNVTHCTFTLENVVDTNNVQIPNPLRSIAYQAILIINFSDANGVIGMFANPNSDRDSSGNRKLIIGNDGVAASAYYPWIDFTADSITLRGAIGGGYPAGTYHIFAWKKIE